MKNVRSSRSGSGRFGVDTQHAQEIVTRDTELGGQGVDIRASLERCDDRLQAYCPLGEDRQAKRATGIDHDISGAVLGQVDSLGPAIGGELDPTQVVVDDLVEDRWLLRTTTRSRALRASGVSPCDSAKS